MGVLYDWLDKSISSKEIYQCYNAIISFWRGTSSKLSLDCDKLDKLSISLNSDKSIDRTSYDLSILVDEDLILIHYDMYTGSCKILQGLSDVDSVIASKAIKGYTFNLLRIVSSLKHSPSFLSLVNDTKNEAYVYQDKLSIHSSVYGTNCIIDKIIIKNADSGYLKRIL